MLVPVLNAILSMFGLSFFIHIASKMCNSFYYCFYVQLLYYPDIGIMVRVFANDLEDLDSIPFRVIPKTQKMVLDASLFNTQQYKVGIKGKVDQSRERSSTLPYTSL